MEISIDTDMTLLVFSKLQKENFNEPPRNVYTRIEGVASEV